MHKVYKDSAKNVFKSKGIIKKINIIVYRCFEIATLTSQFIKLLLIKRYDIERQKRLDKENNETFNTNFVLDDFMYDAKKTSKNKKNNKKKNKKGSKIKSIFTEQFIRQAIKTVTSKDDKRGAQSSVDPVLDEMEKLYKDDFYQLVHCYRPSRTNITHALNDYLATDMKKNYENNIKLHFIQRVKKFVNRFFLFRFNKVNLRLFNKHNKTTDQIKSDKEKYYIRKEKLLKEIKIINTIILGFDSEDSSFKTATFNKYKKTIIFLRKVLIPDIEVSVPYDLVKDPSKFLYHMIYINNEMEVIGCKQNNMLPLIHSFIPTNITLDTSCIIESLFTENKQESYSSVNNNPIEKWRKILKDKVLKPPTSSKFSFSNMITTNGYSVSIHIADNESLTSKDKKNKKMKAKQAQLKLTKDTILEENEEDNILEEIKEEVNKDNNIEDDLEEDDLEEDDLEEVEEETKEEIQIKNKEIKSKKDKDISYIHNESIAKLKSMSGFTQVAGDPGSNNMLHLVGNNKKTLNFSSAQKRFETKVGLNRLKRQKFIEKYPKIKKTVESFNINGKTTNFNKFKDYIKERWRVFTKVESHYHASFYRKLNWHTYINTQKYEDKLIKEISKTYGKEVINYKDIWSKKDKKYIKKEVITYDINNVVIGIGDYSINHTLKGVQPTKGASLKRLISKHFKHTYLIVERYTTATCCYCYKRTEYYKKVTKQPTFTLNKTHMHGLLVCKNKNCSRLLNRDFNGASNNLEILQGHIYVHQRPPFYEKDPTDLSIKEWRQSINNIYL